MLPVVSNWPVAEKKLTRGPDKKIEHYMYWRVQKFKDNGYNNDIISIFEVDFSGNLR